jgi:pimeloyl-ACP methyl ester carboxylesterase
MTIYLVPGLGNDKRIFKNLIEYFQDYKLEILVHLPFLSLEETLCQYAKRLIQKVGEFDEDSIIIGFSLGGLIATEMSKIINFKKVILISTVKHKLELPTVIRVASKFNFQIPASFIKKTIGSISLMLGVTDRVGANYISEIIGDADSQHIIWAQKAASSWNNILIPDNYIHIHGTRDEIFTINFVKASHIIKLGTHYMIMDRAEEIANIIKSEI